jgi:hypothetical protein
MSRDYLPSLASYNFRLLSIGERRINHKKLATTSQPPVEMSNLSTLQKSKNWDWIAPSIKRTG